MKQATLDAIKAFGEGKRIIATAAPAGQQLTAQMQQASLIASHHSHSWELNPLETSHVDFSEGVSYTIASKAALKGKEFPYPEREEPAYGRVFYVPSLQEYDAFHAESCIWYDFPEQRRVLDAGYVHLTAQAAHEHAIALFGLPMPDEHALSSEARNDNFPDV